MMTAMMTMMRLRVRTTRRHACGAFLTAPSGTSLRAHLLFLLQSNRVPPRPRAAAFPLVSPPRAAPPVCLPQKCCLAVKRRAVGGLDLLLLPRLVFFSCLFVVWRLPVAFRVSLVVRVCVSRWLLFCPLACSWRVHSLAPSSSSTALPCRCCRGGWSMWWRLRLVSSLPACVPVCRVVCVAVSSTLPSSPPCLPTQKKKEGMQSPCRATNTSPTRGGTGSYAPGLRGGTHELHSGVAFSLLALGTAGERRRRESSHCPRRFVDARAKEKLKSRLSSYARVPADPRSLSLSFSTPRSPSLAAYPHHTSGVALPGRRTPKKNTAACHSRGLWIEFSNRHTHAFTVTASPAHFLLPFSSSKGEACLCTSQSPRQAHPLPPPPLRPTHRPPSSL